MTRADEQHPTRPILYYVRNSDNLGVFMTPAVPLISVGKFDPLVPRVVRDRSLPSAVLSPLSCRPRCQEVLSRLGLSFTFSYR